MYSQVLLRKACNVYFLAINPWLLLLTTVPMSGNGVQTCLRSDRVRIAIILNTIASHVPMNELILADDFFVGIGDINSTTVPKAPSTVASAVLAAQNKITSERIAAQVEDRPLAKKQELLEEEDQKEGEIKTTTNGAKQKSSDETHEKHNLHHRKALLKNDDTELARVASVRV